MQSVIISSLGYKLNYDVPSSVEEFDRLAKRNGAALDEANKNVLYRSVLATFRDGFLHGVEGVDGLDKVTGIERKTKVTKPEVKDADGKITQEEVTAWDEKEEEYKNRVFATLVQAGNFPSIEAAAAAFAPLAQQILAAIAFDPSKTERVAGPKKTPKSFVGIAEALVELAGSVESAVAKFNAKTGRNVDSTLEALAKGIWEDQTAQKKNIAAGYAN